ARSVLLVVRDKDNPALRVMAPIKANLEGEMPALAFTITEEPVLAWQGVVEVNIAELLAASSPEEQTARGDAWGFLQDILSDGEVPATDVLAEARQCGIAEKTLRRAAKDHGVHIARVGGIGGKGSWAWRLPENDSVDDQDAPMRHVAILAKCGHLSGTEENTKMATLEDSTDTNSTKMATQRMGHVSTLRRDGDATDVQQGGHLNRDEGWEQDL
ncbi:MAG: hypothetical protein QGI09_05595, partial [Dehalococcoidia bacterium]|nr:hypothetical protein [Dehalococcoidia bacterium]